MENVKPSTWMLMGGGILLLLSTFLDWFGQGSFGINAWETDFFGLIGIWCALIGLIIGGGVAATTFGNVKMPETILGFTHKQVHLVLSLFALLITVGYLFAGDIKVGLILGIVASGVMFAGAFMELKDDTSPAAPASEF